MKLKLFIKEQEGFAPVCESRFELNTLVGDEGDFIDVSGKIIWNFNGKSFQFLTKHLESDLVKLLFSIEDYLLFGFSRFDFAEVEINYTKSSESDMKISINANSYPMSTILFFSEIIRVSELFFERKIDIYNEDPNSLNCLDAITTFKTMLYKMQKE